MLRLRRTAPTGTKVNGIDSGLSTSLTFSDTSKINFIRPFKEQEKRLAKAQRKSKNSKKHKALARKVAARRKDYHHKLSNKLAKSHMTIYWSDDFFPRLKKIHGKPYSDLGFGQFRDFLANKLASRTDGFGELIRVPSAYSTQTCHSCGALTGPAGRSGLQVREWTCECCGSTHDRDVNAALYTLLLGLGALTRSDGSFIAESSKQGKSCKSSNIVLIAHDPPGLKVQVLLRKQTVKLLLVLLKNLNVISVPTLTTVPSASKKLWIRW